MYRAMLRPAGGIPAPTNVSDNSPSGVRRDCRADHRRGGRRLDPLLNQRAALKRPWLHLNVDLGEVGREELRGVDVERVVVGREESLDRQRDRRTP